MGFGIADACRFPRVERLAGRQPGGPPAHRGGRLVAAGGLLGEQHAQDLGVLPALRVGGREHLRRRPPHVRQPEPPQQPVELVGQRRRGGWLDGHRRAPIRSACSANSSSSNANSRASSGVSVQTAGGSQQRLPPAIEAVIVGHDHADLLHRPAAVVVARPARDRSGSGCCRGSRSSSRLLPPVRPSVCRQRPRRPAAAQRECAPPRAADRYRRPAGRSAAMS